MKWLAQVASLFAVLALFVAVVSQAAENWARSGTTFGWSWLGGPFGVVLREGIDTQPDSAARAFFVGAVNTVRLSVSAIFAATILGTLIGIGRLSSNWVVNKISTVYIETIRNIPLLLQIFFWEAVAITLPGLMVDDVGEYWFKASNRGFAFAWIFPSDGFWPWLTFIVAGGFVGRYVARWRRKIKEDTGRRTYPTIAWLLTVLVFAIVGWFAWPVLSFLSPVFHGIAGFIDAIPAIVFPILIALAALGGAAWWIRNLFESRRTPAGFGKFTDDDWFRIIFTGFSGIVVAVLAFVVGGLTIETVAGDTATIAELLRTVIANFFDWLGRAFDPSLQEGVPLDPQKAEVVARGAGFINYGTSGMVMSIPFFGVFFAITTYTAAFIAEIVRGGILAIPKGQVDAARAVGLRPSQYLRLIILPLAYRIILPPLGNQYINVIKNASLGVATAFPDIINVGITVINQTGQFRAVLVIWVLFFLSASLAVSGVVNYYNRKLKLVEH